MNDRDKAKLLWAHTAGFRQPFFIAISAMAVGYLFMFGAPLLATFSIDAILEGKDFQPAPWVVTIVSLISVSGEPSMINYLSAAAIGTVFLTVVAGGFLYIRGRYVALAAEVLCEDFVTACLTTSSICRAHSTTTRTPET